MNENFKILITDDSQLMRMVMKSYLMKLHPSCEIKEAINLTESFELLDKHFFDLLLLDINMPGGDSSPDTVREILLKQPNIKICIVSGNKKAELEYSYIESGAIGFIEKDGKLKSSIEELMDSIYTVHSLI